MLVIKEIDIKAFLVGLIFIFALGVLAGIGVLLFPLLLILTFLLRIAVGIMFAIVCIWLLGKLIIFIWDKGKDWFKS